MPVLRFTAAARSIWIWPRPVLIVESPSSPAAWKSVSCPAARTCEPAGSSIVTSIEPPWLLGSHERSFGALISSASPECSTRVRSATLRSSSLPVSLGRTSTTVVPAAPAVMRTSPTTTSIVAVMGSGVLNVGMGRVSLGVSGPSR